MLQEKFCVFCGVTADGLDGLCTVRHTRSISEIHNALAGGERMEFFDNGQTSDTGVEYTNGVI
jgi:hypothetical protein